MHCLILLLCHQILAPSFVLISLSLMAPWFVLAICRCLCLGLVQESPSALSMFVHSDSLVESVSFLSFLSIISTSPLSLLASLSSATCVPLPFLHSHLRTSSLPQPQHLQPPPKVGCSFFHPFFALVSPCPPSLPSFVLVALARALSSRLVLSYSCALSRSLPSCPASAVHRPSYPPLPCQLTCPHFTGPVTLVVVAEIEGESSDSVSYEISLTFPARPTQQQLISRLKERGLFRPELATFGKPKPGLESYIRFREEIPWDNMAVDATGCYQVKLAPRGKPSPPTTPERSLPAGRTRSSPRARSSWLTSPPSCNSSPCSSIQMQPPRLPPLTMSSATLRRTKVDQTSRPGNYWSRLIWSCHSSAATRCSRRYQSRPSNFTSSPLRTTSLAASRTVPVFRQCLCLPAAGKPASCSS